MKALEEARGELTPQQKQNLHEMGRDMGYAIVRPNMFFDKNKFVPSSLASFLMEKHAFKTQMETRTIFYYDEKEGIYKEAEGLIRQETHRVLKEECNNHRVEEALGAIERLTYADCSPNGELVPVKNGVLNLVEGELKPFSPNYFFTSKLAVEYDKKADCLAFKEFLEQVLPAEEDRETIRELFAYCLHQGYEVQKAIMFVGSGFNGKSTLLRTLIAFLGQENVSARTLQSLSENQFAAADLNGKYANVCPDIPATKLFNTGIFKALVGGDLLTVEKKHRDSFTFINTAKLLFSANQVPVTTDESDAFFRRWVIINFPNQFEDKDDVFLLRKLTTPQELSGILNWCLPALTDLLLRGCFSNNARVSELREAYVRKSDSVGAFIMDCTEAAGEEWISKEDLYRAYVEYCNHNKITSLAKQVFGRELPRVAPQVSKYHPRVGGRITQAWKGIRLKNEDGGENPQSTLSA